MTEPSPLEAAKKLLIGAAIGSCTCNTKSPELIWHAPNCRYVAIMTALENVEVAASSPNEEQGPPHWRTWNGAVLDAGQRQVTGPDILEKLQEDWLRLSRGSFDNVDCGLAANVVQEAIDEIARLRASHAHISEQGEEANATIARVWKALGIETYEQAGGKEIGEIVADYKQAAGVEAGLRREFLARAEAAEAELEEVRKTALAGFAGEEDETDALSQINNRTAAFLTRLERSLPAHVSDEFMADYTQDTVSGLAARLAATERLARDWQKRAFDAEELAELARNSSDKKLLDRAEAAEAKLAEAEKALKRISNGGTSVLISAALDECPINPEVLEQIVKDAVAGLGAPVSGSTEAANG